MVRCFRSGVNLTAGSSVIAWTGTRCLLFDGQVSPTEASGLCDWIQSNPSIRRDPLAAAVVDRVFRIFADGILEPTELSDLRDLLKAFAGEVGKSTSLPLNSPPPAITISGRSFCFTGKFVSGGKAWCQGQTESRAGIVSARVYGSLHYLVIGSIPSPAWINMDYNTKIESAVQLRDQEKAPIALVSEAHWLSAWRAP